MFLPAKNEMTTHAQIESRREYFLQFNYVYTPDRYIWVMVAVQNKDDV